MPIANDSGTDSIEDYNIRLIKYQMSTQQELVSTLSKKVEDLDSIIIRMKKQRASERNKLDIKRPSMDLQGATDNNKDMEELDQVIENHEQLRVEFDALKKLFDLQSIGSK